MKEAQFDEENNSEEDYPRELNYDVQRSGPTHEDREKLRQRKERKRQLYDLAIEEYQRYEDYLSSISISRVNDFLSEVGYQSAVLPRSMELIMHNWESF